MTLGNTWTTPCTEVVSCSGNVDTESEVKDEYVSDFQLFFTLESRKSPDRTRINVKIHPCAGKCKVLYTVSKGFRNMCKGKDQ